MHRRTDMLVEDDRLYLFHFSFLFPFSFYFPIWNSGFDITCDCHNCHQSHDHVTQKIVEGSET